MNKLGDFAPDELKKKFGITEEKQEVRRVTVYDEDDCPDDDEIVKENRATVSNLSRSRYSKSYVKIQPQYEPEEPGIMTTASTLMIIRGNLLKKWEGAKYDKTNGNHVLCKILLKRAKKKKPVTIKNLMSIVLHEYKHVPSFSSDNEDNVRKSLTNMMNKIASIFGPDNTEYDLKENIFDTPVITKTTQKRRKRMGKFKIGGRNPVVYHITEEFLEYEAAQIWAAANEWSYEKSKQKKAGNTLVPVIKDRVAAKKNIKGHKTLDELIEFRDWRLNLNKKNVFDPTSGSHLVVKWVLGRVKANEEVNIKILHEVTVANFLHTAAFSSGKDDNIRKYLSQMMGKIVDVFPDLIKRVKTLGTGHDFIFDKSILGYTVPQLWATANDKAAFDRKMGRTKIEIPEDIEEVEEGIEKVAAAIGVGSLIPDKVKEDIKEVLRDSEPEEEVTEKIFPEAEELLIEALDELSKETEELSTSLAEYVEPPAPPVRRSKGLLESNVDDIIESLKESGGGSLNVSITIDVKGKK